MKKKPGRPRIAANKKRRSVTFVFSPELANLLSRIEDKNRWAEAIFMKILKGE